MRRNYNEWMMEEVKELTPTGKLKRPSYETVDDHSSVAASPIIVMDLRTTGFLTMIVLGKQID